MATCKAPDKSGMFWDGKRPPPPPEPQEPTFAYTQLTEKDMRELAAGIVTDGVRDGAIAMLAVFDNPFDIKKRTA